MVWTYVRMFFIGAPLQATGHAWVPSGRGTRGQPPQDGCLTRLEQHTPVVSPVGTTMNGARDDDTGFTNAPISYRAMRDTDIRFLYDVNNFVDATFFINTTDAIIDDHVG